MGYLPRRPRFSKVYGPYFGRAPENPIIVEKEAVQLIQESPDTEPLTEIEPDFPEDFASLAL
jgi:hypothetical protein